MYLAFISWIVFLSEFMNKHKDKVNQLTELGLKPSPDTLVDGRVGVIACCFLSMH